MKYRRNDFLPPSTGGSATVPLQMGAATGVGFLLIRFGRAIIGMNNLRKADFHGSL